MARPLQNLIRLDDRVCLRYDRHRQVDLKKIRIRSDSRQQVGSGSIPA
ncbi:MAG TPA: hypothetical protein VLL97_00425 [Acidobacteriota bacterium]|nr:hypothetical protein [Acidobacteriota bacterium]